MNELDVITLGETMVAFAADEPGPLAEASHYTRIVAGAESNVGVGLARLGVRVAWVSRLGRDSFGDYVRRAIEREGVDCSAVVVDDTRPTGFMLKSRANDASDPTVEYFRRGSAASALSPPTSTSRAFSARATCTSPASRRRSRPARPNSSRPACG
jgi:sugar/nucleoside kinase (ribokinase family)